MTNVYDNPWIYVHAPDNTRDYTLCGLSQDGVLLNGDKNNGKALPIAKIGDLVTCPDCKAKIAFCKIVFKRNRRVE